MYKKAWFRLLAWSMAIFFFFVTSMTFACLLSPPPHGEHVEKWMMAMEKAMEDSLMGIAMHGSSDLAGLIFNSMKLIPLFAGLGLLFGLLMVLWGMVHEK